MPPVGNKHPSRSTNAYRDMAQTLYAMGLDRNDRLAIMLSIGLEMAVAFMAVAASATSTLLNPAYGEAECDFCLADLSAVAPSSDGHVSTNPPLQASPLASALVGYRRSSPQG
jgi:acyl-CoA synthetase (AMP-forming)/AMP-acid ligase II